MNKKQSRIYNLIIMCLVMGFLMVINGCAPTIQKRNVSESGFLINYSQLKEGTGDQALDVYIDQSADFASYTQMIIDPVSIVVTEDSDLAKVSAGDRQKMADYFFAALNKNLSAKYNIVSSPGAGTMRLRVAMTDIKESNVTMDTISTVLPISLAIDLLGFAATGSHSFVGAASTEMELLDSATGQRLAAAADARGGNKITGEFDFTDWKDPKQAFDYWAQKITQRLDQLSGRK
jgi:uncharacterized protein DUF3313